MLRYVANKHECKILVYMLISYCYFVSFVTNKHTIPFFLLVVLQSGKSFLWPDAAVPAITALEKVCNDALSADFQKYNQKMRQLVFNLKVRKLSVFCVRAY